MDAMPHIIEAAKSGRSTCRTCGAKIEKGLLRFGEEVPNAFDPDGGTTHQWHHLVCAAKKRPHQVTEALPSNTEPIPDQAALDAALHEGLATAKPPFPFAEHASTGRARCQACRKGIEKGELRVAIARPNDGMPGDGAMYLHVGCALEHTKDAALLAALEKHSRGLTPQDVDALRTALTPPG